MSEETSIGGRPAVYMETAPAEGDSAENSSTEGTANENTTGAKKIYMIYAEHNYLLEMFIFPDVTKEEAFQIAEGVSITPTEETSGENVMQVCSWNDMENEAGKGEPEYWLEENPEASGSILSTMIQNGKPAYGYMDGTSMACPHVSGVAALGLSYAVKQRRHFKADEFVKLLKESVKPVNSFYTGTKKVLQKQRFLMVLRSPR